MLKILLGSRGVYGIITEFIVHHLERQEDLEVHDHCDPHGLPALVPETEPDAVLMVVGIPGKDDVANISAIRRAHGSCPIIAVSLALDPKLAVEPLVEAGVTRIVPEGALDLPEAIREVAAQATCR